MNRNFHHALFEKLILILILFWIIVPKNVGATVIYNQPTNSGTLTNGENMFFKGTDNGAMRHFRIYVSSTTPFYTRGYIWCPVSSCASSATGIGGAGANYDAISLETYYDGNGVIDYFFNNDDIGEITDYSVMPFIDFVPRYRYQGMPSADDFFYGTSICGSGVPCEANGTMSVPGNGSNNGKYKFTVDTGGLGSFYAPIKNTDDGDWNLRNGSSTSATILKTLPDDWVVYVASTTDASGNPITANGYNWYQVTDPTDNVSGWMAGEDASSTVHFLSYDPANQATFVSSSTTYIATSSRPELILQAIDHYYNDASTTYSLYSSDDGNNDISVLNDRDFEKKIIWGIAARESGGIDFNNEYVRYAGFEYGHGIMQISFVPESWDNRGIGSFVTIPPCEPNDLYSNCYAGINPAHYQPYGGSGSVTYKQYTNTQQSIYSNIKDGLKVLQYKYDNFYPISTSTTVNGTTYTANQREIILVTEGYNGACGYVNDVASTTEDIDSYFPTATSSDITTLIQKMHTAGNEVVCAQLHSPGDLSIKDSEGRTVGVINGKMVNNFPLAISDKNHKEVKILSPESTDYIYQVVGTAKGVYGLDITLKDGDKKVIFNAKDIPTLPNEIHSYSVDKEALLEGKEGVILEIDNDGDGTVDRTIKSGGSLTSESYSIGATPEELEILENKNKYEETVNTQDIKLPSIERVTKERFIPKSLDTTHTYRLSLPIKHLNQYESNN